MRKTSETVEKKLDKLLLFITDYNKENQYFPTYREIMKIFQINSTSLIQYYLKKLELRGDISFIKSNKKRKIKLINKTSVNISKKDNETSGSINITIPLLGRNKINDFFNIENQIDEYSFSSNFFNCKDIFMIENFDDSMIELGIFSGDKLIVKKQDFASNGEIIVANINNFLIIRTYFKEGTRIRLQSANFSYAPIFLTSINILGIVISSIKMFR